ncbi:related to serine/threonine-protein kinase [Serendipita indica DSM 11827]|uniref:Related to serine/threonine-protein kinase n=1 Tax=Serendipita indica (strain DSM 11827) TaxID=1109443 RepID=G4TCP3_SERID|nr:related to serine/threonine-protein kinase [Serendipita indica DSM 11827]
MDAFKNFIRHGKHARAHNQQQQQQTQNDANSEQARKEAALAAAEAKRHERAEREREEKQQAMKDKAHHTQAAEAIVKEERAASSKMPYIKGLERFRLLDKMGDGAFSNVYKALDTQTGQKVAIKVVRKYELNSTQEGNKHLNPELKKKKPRATERANILKEVQIMRGIDHPSIVKLISFSESDEHYFFGAGAVKLTYFSEPLARHVILQVAHGIRYLHEERGVVHRDIKPENLLFERIPIIPSKNPINRPYDEEKEDEGEFINGLGGGGIGRVKIADFGLSKIVWNEDTMTPCGTVGYTAPEIVKDERYSKSVDMWALGCVLYTLLCGFPPFYDESINVLTEKVARGYYTFLSPWWDDISASSKDLITHLLCVDPAQRYTIDEFLNHPWCKEAQGSIQPAKTPAVNHPLDSPLLQSAHGVAVGRSPGLATLKEAFDITYAVHRMEEEGARRRGANFLGDLNEDDEDEEDSDQAVINSVKQRQNGNLTGAQGAGTRGVDTGTHMNRDAAKTAYQGGRAGPRDRGDRKKGFELNLGGATLLGRRRKTPPEVKMAEGYGQRVPVHIADAGTPMSVV